MGKTKSTSWTKYKRQRRKKNRLKKYLFGGLFFCLLICVIYFSIFWNGLWIRNIEIIGDEEFDSSCKNIVSEILNQRFYYIIPQKSILIVSGKRINTEILNKFPEIGKAEIYKKFPHTLKIKLEKREPVGIWCYLKRDGDSNVKNETKCFYIDKKGVIFKIAPKMEGGLMINIYQKRKDIPFLGEKVISEENMNFILEAENRLKSENLVPITFYLNYPDVKVFVKNGFYIYMTFSNSLDSQIYALSRTLKEIKGEKLQYIDLRIKGRVYYK